MAACDKPSSRLCYPSCPLLLQPALTNHQPCPHPVHWAPPCLQAVDDLGALLARFASGPAHSKAVLFCDNAGADVLLGMLPLGRELLKRGTGAAGCWHVRAAVQGMHDSPPKSLDSLVAAQQLPQCLSSPQLPCMHTLLKMPPLPMRLAALRCAACRRGVGSWCPLLPRRSHASPLPTACIWLCTNRAPHVHGHPAEVVLAANSFPSINDITAAELAPLLAAAAAADPSVLGPGVAEGRIRVVANGSDTPVIDLRRLSPQLCAEAEHADLVVLEGMGRGIETNLRAAFACDCMCLALIKHPEVACCLGGRLYDVVCRFQPRPGAPLQAQ